MKRILLSGFEAFAGGAVNPTSLLMATVENGRVAVPVKSEVRTVVLPVTFGDAFSILDQEIDAFEPDIVLAFGQAAGRDAVEFERVAINCMDANIADNSGRLVRDEPIEPDGNAAYFATLPIRDLSEAVSQAGVPSRISNTAGLYVCNFLMYRLLEMSHGTERQAGFVHVPLLPEQGAPSLPLESLIRALEIILQALAT